MSGASTPETIGNRIYHIEKNLITDQVAFRNALDRIFPSGYEIHTCSQQAAAELGMEEAERQDPKVMVIAKSGKPQTYNLKQQLRDEGVILADDPGDAAAAA
jgi:hypothetical protein